MKINRSAISIEPKISKQQILLLEKLSNAPGVSGNEDAVRDIVLTEVKPYADDLKIDAMGNLLVTRHAKVIDPIKVMLAAHMDEVGFMIVEEESEGLFLFECVGGVDERQLIAKPVLVGKDQIPGIIGSKPIHLTDPEDLHRSISVEQMRIDVGPTNGSKVRTGDYANFATKFFTSGDSMFGKALDDRLGVVTLIELLKTAPDSLDLLFAFTVQEEIGLRGARIAGYNFKPDMAFVIDSTPAFDLPRPDGKENSQYNTRLMAGPAVYIADAGTISDPRLIKLLVSTADEYNIPYQFRQPGGGGTDAGSIHKTGPGVPSVSVSIPGRYAHSPILHAKQTDWENILRLLHYSLRKIDRLTLSMERP